MTASGNHSVVVFAMAILVACSTRSASLQSTQPKERPLPPWPLSTTPEGVVVAIVTSLNGETVLVPVLFSANPQLLDPYGCLASNLGPPRLVVTAKCIRIGGTQDLCIQAGGYSISYTIEGYPSSDTVVPLPPKEVESRLAFLTHVERVIGEAEARRAMVRRTVPEDPSDCHDYCGDESSLNFETMLAHRTASWERDLWRSVLGEECPMPGPSPVSF